MSKVAIFLIVLALFAVSVDAKKAKKNKQPAATTWDVQIGADSVTEDGYNIMGMAFYPSILNVRQGDFIRFTLKSMEGHIVTFGQIPDVQTAFLIGLPGLFAYFNPMGNGVFDGTSVVNSGIMEEMDSTWTIQITAPAGTYKYKCPLHPAMVAYVNVVGTGKANNDADFAAAEIDYNLMYGTTLISHLWSQTETESASYDHLVAVAGGNGLTSIFSFVPLQLTVKVNEIIRFVNYDPYVPHTVSIGTVANPGAPIAGQTPMSYSGGNINSGYLWAAPGLPASFDMKFTAAGTYDIYCAVHPMLQQFTLTVEN